MSQKSAVGYVSDYRFSSDCRSRGHMFDPGPVPYWRKIDHEFIFKVILLPSADLLKKGCFQLQAKVCARITGSLPRKKVWLVEVQNWPSLMTNAVDWDVN